MRIFKSAVERAEESFENGQYAKAAELFAKAGEWRRVAEIREHRLEDLAGAAEAFEKADEPLEAARVLEQAGKPREAVPLYQRAGALRKAGEASLAADDPERAAGFFEQVGLYERASDCYLDVGHTERALRVLEKEREELEKRRDDRPDRHLDDRLRLLDLRRADISEKLGRYTEAARLFEQHGETRRAARLFEESGNAERAAELYLAIDHHEDALRLAEESEVLSADMRAEILLNAAKHVQAAEILEEVGKYGAAAQAYEDAGELAHSAALWKRDGSYAKAADLYERVDRHYDAAQCWALADEHARAGEAFLRAEATRNAADAFATAEAYLRAGRCYLDAGQDEDARKVFSEIRPGDPDYFEASFELVPLFLDIGEGQEAGSRLRAIKDAGRRFTAHQIDYCHGRIFEFRRRYAEAERAYQEVLSEHPEYRDTRERLDDVRSRLDDPTLTEVDEGPGTGITQTLRAEVHSTQRVMKSTSADTGAMPDRVSLEPISEDTGWQDITGQLADLDEEVELEESAELPVVLEEHLDKWWDGAEFWRVRERKTGSARFMVSFPLAFVGDRVKHFEIAIRQVAALRQRAILELKGMVQAGDKVLLFYETFDGEPLSNIVYDRHRGFTPRATLHLLVQLCEALTSAHKLGVTHQWLSPKTVLVDGQNRCKIVGLGLREFLAGQDSTSLAYQSPEVRDDGVIGPTSDVFSLGLLAMALLEVVTPVKASTDPEDYHWPRVVEEEFPASLRHFLVRCLDPDPVARPSTSEMAASLAAMGFVSGQVLAERYEVVGEIGRGGMSRVYRAVDSQFGIDVAIKTVFTAALDHREDEDRLMREVHISRKISHPNVVRVHDLGRFPGGIFMIMELLDGPGLDQVIAKEAPLELERAKRILLEITGALVEAHRLDIIHRDLKPGNVILVDDRAKVLDFGIAHSADGNPHLTRTGEVIGSPLYMSPEQIQGKELEGTSDLYSLGVIAFALLTGREPFAADNATEVVMKHLREPPPDASALRPGGLPAPWLDLLDTLLRKDPSERPASAEALVEILESLPTATEPDS